MTSTVAWMSVAFAWMAAQQNSPPAQPPARLPEPKRVVESIAPTVHITGTAVAVDDSGNEHAHEDGLVRALQWPAGVIEIPVQDGRFEADVRADAKVTCASLMLGGRSVAIGGRSIANDAGAPIALRGEWIPDFVLHVVDATTHAELKECEWVFGPGTFDPVDLEASRKRDGWSAKGVTSPLHLTREGRYWVRAPGHAWQMRRFSVGAEQNESDATLELPAACRLIVDLPEPARGANRWLGLGSASGRDWVAFVAPAAGPMQLDSLPPGETKLRTLMNFHLRPWNWHDVTLASVTATIRADQVATISLPREGKPAGLLDDGTVDRTAIVSIAGAKRDESRCKSGSIGFYYFFRGSGDLRQIAANGDEIAELTREGLEINRELECDVKDGSVKLRPPFGGFLYLSRVVLDGKAYELGNERLVFDTSPEPFKIVIPDPESIAGPRLTLHVREKGTGSELEHVCVARFNFEHHADGDSGFSVHPGHHAQDDLVLADGVSPVVLRDPTGRRSREPLFVGAAGFAWTKTECNWVKGGEQVVELERACELAITLDPPTDATELQLKVYRARDREEVIAELRGWLTKIDPTSSDPGQRETRADYMQQIADLERGDPAEQLALHSGMPLLRTNFNPSGVTTIDGLPRALLDVAVCNGLKHHFALGATLVDGRDGGRHQVVIHVRSDAFGARVPMAGTLFIPHEWGKIDWSLRAEPMGKLKSTIQGPLQPSLKPGDVDDPKGRQFSWDAGSVLPGTFRVALSSSSADGPIWDYFVDLEVGATGDRNLRIDIPPPSDVRIDFVDASTGAPALIGRSSCSVEEISEDHARTRARMFGPDPGSPGTVRFRAASGEFRLRIEDKVYGDVRQILELSAGADHHTIRLSRTCGVRLRLLNGTSPIDWDDDIDVTVKSIGPDGTATEIEDIPPFGPAIKLPAPGRYRLEFETDDDSTSIAPVEVTVPAGDFVDVNVRLEKRS